MSPVYTVALGFAAVWFWVFTAVVLFRLIEPVQKDGSEWSALTWVFNSMFAMWYAIVAYACLRAAIGGGG
jgi:hypothetical protein